jgi:hypothetical protein
MEVRELIRVALWDPLALVGYLEPSTSSQPFDVEDCLYNPNPGISPVSDAHSESWQLFTFRANTLRSTVAS